MAVRAFQQAFEGPFDCMTYPDVSDLWGLLGNPLQLLLSFPQRHPYCHSVSCKIKTVWCLSEAQYVSKQSAKDNWQFVKPSESFVAENHGVDPVYSVSTKVELPASIMNPHVIALLVPVPDKHAYAQKVSNNKLPEVSQVLENKLWEFGNTHVGQAPAQNVSYMCCAKFLLRSLSRELISQKCSYCLF